MRKKYYLFEMKTSALTVVSLVLLIAMVSITDILIKISPEEYIVFGGIAIVLLFPYFILHEILHSIGYVINGADFKNITYGAHLEKGILCCLCKQNVSKKNILISLLFPFIFIGVITYIIAIVTNNYTLAILSAMNISGCSGDLMMLYSLSKIKNYEYSEYDNPIAFGLYTDEDLSNKELPFLKYLGAEDELERKDLRKVVISKTSIIFFIIFELLGVVSLFI